MRKIVGKETLIKLYIPWPDANGGISGESVWAKRLNDTLCRIDNDPLHPSVSYGDLVKFEIINGMPTANLPLPD